MAEEYNEFKKKYLEKLDIQLSERKAGSEWKPIVSKDYLTFKKEYISKALSRYEKACQISEKVFKVSPDATTRKNLEESIAILHLNVTPEGVTGFSFLGPLLIAFFGAIFGYLIFESLFFVAFFVLLGAGLYFVFGQIPFFMAQNYRMKASNQMVLCIFYIVTYMRHTSNLERAIVFAAEHLDPPISLDLKKVLWDVETGKYESIKDSMDSYLDSWKKYNMEFIESFHLIESSLFESGEKRRLELLDKSLDVMLQGTYEKMLHYAQNLQGPIQMMFMMGVILPILGLVILPLIVSFLTDKDTSPYIIALYIAFLYNLVLPIAVYYIGKNILAKRPTGYGESDISNNPAYKKLKDLVIKIGKKEVSIDPKHIAIGFASICIIIGFLPLLLHLVASDFDIYISKEFGIYTKQSFDAEFGENSRPMLTLEEYRPSKGDPTKLLGPYGLGAAMLSLFITIGLSVSMGLYYKIRTSRIIKIRDETKALEKEFASALFQLGNRLADGIPVEIAFARVAESMEGTRPGEFFAIVTVNMRKLGMGVEQAIFDPKQGALQYYPSNLIESSMKVLVESARKGPSIAAAALINVSEYIKEIHRVEERLADLLSETMSSMKSQISFLTPVIAGIVVGITSMIVAILGALGTQLEKAAAQGGGADAGASSGLLELFGDGVPTYHFQLIVGLYVFQITYVLSIIQNGVGNGSDSLSEEHILGNNLINSTILYTIISFAIMVVFNFVASAILTRSGI